MIHLDLAVNFCVNLVAILILTGAFYYTRHRRRDLFVIFTFFNIAMFIIVTLISHTQLGIGASFGLFALLAIIRLRSEEFSNYEVGYFFGCLTLAIINGLGGHNPLLMVSMDLVILISIGLLDHPRVLRGVRHCQVNLDAVYTDDAKIAAALERVLQAKILAFSITRIDNVRDITTANVEYQKLPVKVRVRA